MCVQKKLAELKKATFSRCDGDCVKGLVVDTENASEKMCPLCRGHGSRVNPDTIVAFRQCEREASAKKTAPVFHESFCFRAFGGMTALMFFCLCSVESYVPLPFGIDAKKNMLSAALLSTPHALSMSTIVVMLGITLPHLALYLSCIGTLCWIFLRSAFLS